MGLFPRPQRPDQPPARLSLIRFLLIILLIYGCIRVFTPHFRLPHVALPHISMVHPPTPMIPEILPDNSQPDGQMHYFSGRRVRGNGTAINLGDRHTHLPGSLLSKFFPDPMILNSCLTEPAPIAATPQKPLPVRDDWPGFYGAPWVAHIDGNLVVLLNVFAPRNTALAVPATEFQLYPNYDGKQPNPAFAAPAPVRFYRGSKAVLYRVFLTGPARCLDLIVQNGENNGTGHLYYQKYHHYYQSDAVFVIQQ